MAFITYKNMRSSKIHLKSFFYNIEYYQDNGFWIEPQAELTYGYITYADFTTNRGIRDIR